MSYGETVVDVSRTVGRGRSLKVAVALDILACIVVAVMLTGAADIIARLLIDLVAVR